jgi:CRISPR-associated protein Csy2
MSNAVRYLMLPRMVVKDFNAESNQYVAGIPAMTAFTGYGHVLERKMQASGWHVQVEGVAVLLHDMQLQAGHPKCPAAMKGAKDLINPPIIEEIKGDMRVTLVLRLTWDEDDIDIWDWVGNTFDQFTSDELRLVYDWVLSLPCCGGSCHSVGSIKIFGKGDNRDKLTQQLRRIHQVDTGYFITPRDDLLALTPNAEQQDILDVLLDTQRLTTYKDEHGQQKCRRDQKGWLIPLAVGYQAIEIPQTRRGVRNASHHVYAEPLTGLGELVHASSPLWRPDFDLETLCWVHQHDPMQHTYYVTTLKENTRG